MTQMEILESEVGLSWNIKKPRWDLSRKDLRSMNIQLIDRMRLLLFEGNRCLQRISIMKWLRWSYPNANAFGRKIKKAQMGLEWKTPEMNGRIQHTQRRNWSKTCQQTTNMKHIVRASILNEVWFLKKILISAKIQAELDMPSLGMFTHFFPTIHED